MLGFEKKVLIEKSILATFIVFPTVGFKLISKLKRSHFSSDGLADLFEHIFNEKQIGKQIVMSELRGDLLETAKQCFGHDHLHNLKSNIKLLIEEGYINEMWRLGQQLQEMAVNDRPLIEIVNYNQRKVGTISLTEQDEHNVTMADAIKGVKDGTFQYKEYHLGIHTIDTYAPVSAQSINILGGSEGTFKTKFMIFMVRKLLKNYSNIAVLWYSMEDPVDKIIRAFTSQDVFLTDSELKKVDYTSLIPNDIKKFDIQFVTKSQSMKAIGAEFSKFREERPQKFNLLIIDNLMKVIPVDPKMDPDLEIIREIESWNIKTSTKEASVYLLHHLTKSVNEANNKKFAYTPRIEDLRGRGTLKDFATTVMLVNAMYSHPDIIELFKGYEDFLKKYYIIDIAKNKNEKKTKIHMLAFPEYNWFFEL